MVEAVKAIMELSEPYLARDDKAKDLLSAALHSAYFAGRADGSKEATARTLDFSQLVARLERSQYVSMPPRP